MGGSKRRFAGWHCGRQTQRATQCPVVVEVVAVNVVCPSVSEFPGHGPLWDAAVVVAQPDNMVHHRTRVNRHIAKTEIRAKDLKIRAKDIKNQTHSQNS